MMKQETNNLSTDIHSAFELLSQHELSANQIILYKYRHRITDAVHYHFAADHDESAFMVAFRTQPMDSKGAAHILEHTVLCGSERFPIRDPFFGMLRRSLNTFMNAMTNSDWTAYPFATQNHKDFQNLLSVYLDAVFAANINPLDFSQEGIRVELNDLDQPVFKGVVFNEMKGALSPPARQLFHQIAQHLYSHTTYHYNSGGDPAEITQLTHTELLEFYKKHYHPSNAIFMTFGRHDVYELHSQFENLVLHKFQRGETLFSTPETRLAQPKLHVDTYAIDDEKLTDKTFHALSWLLPTTEDRQLWFGLRLVTGILLENSASPLRHYLETCGYSQSAGPILGLNDQNYEMTFTCSVQGANPEDAETFKQGVLTVLSEVASKPIDTEVLQGLLHQIELYQRDISGNGTPYGLSLMFKGLSSLIHHHDPLEIWDIDQVLTQVKQRIQDDPMWIPRLIQTYLVDNPHRLQLTFKPDTDKSARIRQEEQDKLDQIAASLTDQDREQLQTQAQLLKQRQELQDDYDQLPKVTLADVPADIHITEGRLEQLDIAGQQYPLHVYPAGTNGLYYQQVLIDIPKDILASPHFPICISLVGQVGAGTHDYLKLQQLKTAVTGGVWMSSSLRSKINHQNQISRFLVLSTRSLAQKHDAIELLKLTFEQLRFDEKPRILEILRNQKVHWQSSIMNNGQSYALQNASRNMSAMANYLEQNDGLAAFNSFDALLEQITQDDTAYIEFITELRRIHVCLLQASRQFLIVCESLQVEILKNQLTQVWSDANEFTDFDYATTSTALSDNTQNLSAETDSSVQYDEKHPLEHQAWLTQINVQFCAQAFPAVGGNHADTAAFMVLGPYLSNEFLHHAIREQGGAYGGGANYDANAYAFRFYSYRDPRLEQTFADFDASIDWLLKQSDNQQALESAILTTISGMDKPASPAQEAIGTCHARLHGRTAQTRRQIRQDVLNVSLSDLKRITAKYLKPSLAQKSVVAPISEATRLENLGFQVNKVV